MIKRLVIIFKNDKDLLLAIQQLQDQNIKISNVYSPYPIHGLEQILGMKRPILPIIAFMAGSGGALFALLFQRWTHLVAWPMNIGGKPNFPLLSFIPITFEGMILAAAISIVSAFFILNKLAPRFKTWTIFERTTHDRFAITLDPIYNAINKKEIEQLLQKSNVHLILEKELVYEKNSL